MERERGRKASFSERCKADGQDVSHPKVCCNNTSSAELDFVVQRGARIAPIKVKAEESLKAKSLRTYVTDNKGLKSIHFSMSDYRDQEWMENIPLHAVGEWMTRLT